MVRREGTKLRQSTAEGAIIRWQCWTVIAIAAIGLVDIVNTAWVNIGGNCRNLH